MNNPNSDIERMRQEYARRAESPSLDERYSSTNPAYQWILATRQQAIISILKRSRNFDLPNVRILEMGCGSGGVLQEFISLGAEPSNVYGVDLLHDRLRVANDTLKESSWITANGADLPFPSDSFDLVLQFTAFSSILDPALKLTMAAEMMRVLKPGQGVLWYDFIWNPLNHQTRGIPLSEIRQLFPETSITSHRITLAPPLTRLFLPRLRSFAESLTRLAFLNSHLICWIQKPGGPDMR